MKTSNNCTKAMPSTRQLVRLTATGRNQDWRTRSIKTIVIYCPSQAFTGLELANNHTNLRIECTWNMSGIGPFGTCSFSITDGYTDTSSLPLGLEKAANLLQPESENQKWCRTE